MLRLAWAIGLVCVIGAAVVIGFKLWRGPRPDFCEAGVDRSGWATWRLATAFDTSGNKVLFDQAKNALFVLPAVEERHVVGGHLSAGSLVMGRDMDDKEYLLSDIDNTLFVCDADARVHRFTLPSGLAVAVAMAAREGRCADLREMLLEHYSAPDAAGLRALLYDEGSDEVSATTGPAASQP